jgi:hypothetical protein
MAKKIAKTFERRNTGLAISTELFLTLLKPILEDELPDDSVIIDLKYEPYTGTIKFIVQSMDNEILPEGSEPYFKTFRKDINSNFSIYERTFAKIRQL